MTEPPSWPAPSGDQPDQSGYGPPPPPSYPPQYGAPQYGAPRYGTSPGYGPPPGWGPQPGWGPAQGYQPYAAQAAKPGIIPLRPLAVSEILDGAFSTIRRHPKATLGLSAAVACLQQALVLGSRAAFGTLTSTPQLFGSSDTNSANEAVRYFLALAVSLIISGLVGALLTGALSLIVSDSILGHPTSAGAAWQRLRPQVWRLLVVSVIVTVAEVFGLALCLVPGVFLWGAWALVAPALVLERTTVGGALRRSWRLAVPSWWRVFGIRALGQLIAGALAGTLTFGSSLLTLHGAFTLNSNGTTTTHISTTAVIVAAVVGVVVVTLTAPFLAGMVTLLYVDRRIRAEALDVQLQQAASTPAVAAGPGAPGMTYG